MIYKGKTKSKQGKGQHTNPWTLTTELFTKWELGCMEKKSDKKWPKNSGGEFWHFGGNGAVIYTPNE